jgi:type I restriction enzyme, S subunit
LHYEKLQDGTVKCIEDEIPFEVPEGWAWARVSSVVQIYLGLTHTPDYVNKGVPFYSVKDISSGGLDTSNPKYISEEEFDNFPSGAKPQKGDILFGRVGTLGKPTVVEIEEPFGIFVSLGFFRKIYEDFSSEYIMEWMDSSLFWNQVSVNVKGAVLTNLNTGWLSRFLMPIPPIREQVKISDYVKVLLAKTNFISTTEEELINLVTVSKSKILDLAIRGKLVPQDPNDEPASVLLERIRAEKEELIKQGKIKRDKKESIIFRGDDNSYYEKIGNKVNCIDEEIPFEVPECWDFIRLKTAWELISGRDLSPSEYNDKNNGIPYITGASNFENGHISLVRWTPVPQVITRRGDLLLTCKGTIGEIAYNNFGEAHIARQIMAIRNNYSLNVDFLALCIEYSMTKIKQAAKGLIPGISRDDILNLVIPIPPTKEQEIICNKLKITFSAIEHIEKSLN